MNKYIPVIILLMFSHFVVGAAGYEALLPEQQVLFVNDKKLSIKEHIPHGNLSEDIPNFYGIYRIGADLVQRQVNQFCSEQV